MAKDQSRIKNIMRNTAYGFVGQTITYLSNFAYRTVFIYVLGLTYLGIYGLFSSVLSVLSLAELGIGSAITFSLYKPLAEKDNKQVKAIMAFYGTIYKAIGAFVAIAGVSIVPFLDYFIKEKPDIANLTVIYFLFLADSVVSYFFAYKRAIIIADQQNHIDINNQSIFMLIRCVLQIVVLLLTGNFIATLIVQVICTFAANLSIFIKVNKLYPYLKQKSEEKLDREYRKDLFKKIRAMLYHKVGGTLIVGTDNLLISSFLGLYWVGLYANYAMIISIVSAFCARVQEPLDASVGNMVAVDKVDKAYYVFQVLFFINYWVNSFLAICLLILINPFILLWIGREYTLEQILVVMMVFNFYIFTMRRYVLSFRNSLGLYWNDRYRPILEAVIKLVAAVVLLRQYGIAGVFMGTMIGAVTTTLWIEPYILFKHYFKSSVKAYFIKYFLRLILTVILAVIIQMMAQYIFNGTWYSFILLLLICVIVINTAFYLMFFRTAEFQYVLAIVRKWIDAKREVIIPPKTL